MKVKILIITFLLNSFLIYSQKHITSIDLGYNINNSYSYKGWSIGKWKIDEGSNYQYKIFIYNPSKARKGAVLEEYKYNGGKEYVSLYIFHDKLGKVVAIKKETGMTYAGSNTLRSFLNKKRNKKNLSSQLPNIIELDDVEKNNLKRYYSIFIKNEKGKVFDEVQVLTVDNQVLIEEYYYPTSSYQSVSWVSNPYQKVKKLSSQFDEKEFLKLCKDVTKREKKSDEICKCVIRGMKKSYKDNMGDLELSNLYSDAFSKCFSNTNYFKSKKFKVIMPEGKPQVFYQTIVNLNLRKEPKTNSKVIVMIPKRNAVLSKEEFTGFEDTFLINEKDVKAKWVKVWYGKLQGWLFMGGLKVTDPEHYADQEYYKRLKKKN